MTDSPNFTHSIALVTGAGSGIGATLAWRFAREGARVAVHYNRSAAGASAVVDRIVAEGGTAVALQADVSDEADVARLFEACQQALGPVDVLVNNAGIYPLHRLLEMRPADWDDVVNANLRSAFLCTQAAARQMIASRRGGAIVNIASIEADFPAPGHAHYNAAKAGLQMLTRAGAAELGKHGIRVNAVAPGLIWREGLEQAWPEGVARYAKAAPLGRIGQPEDVANAVIFLASEAAAWITGASLTVDGGVTTGQTY
jgi:NAD(P)-dependent dehydrogenase (short-subunit alcohol dehydrogenase family)